MEVEKPAEFPIFLRVVEEPLKLRKKSEPFPKQGPNDRLTLVFDTETTTDARQELRFGIAQFYSNARLVRIMVFTGEVTLKEQETISRWAAAHNASVQNVFEFVTQEFLPLAVTSRAVVVGFNLPFDLARIAAEWEPKRKIGGKRAWTLSLIPRSNPKWAFVPRLRIERVHSAMSFISFTGTKNRFRKYTGAFVDLRTFVRALTGEKHSLESAGEAFGCVRAKTKVEYSGPVTNRFLDYGLNDVELTWELYRKCRDRYAQFGLDVHPSRIYSSASLAKEIWKARGIVPPVLPPKIAGRLMASFHAGKVECNLRAREVEDVSVLDFTSQFPSLFCLLGAERFLGAERVTTQRSTEEIRTWVEGLTVEQLLRRETWLDPRWWSLCEVESSGSILPIRSTYSGRDTDAPTIGWNQVTTELGLTLPFMVADAVAAKLLCGKAPRIVLATTFKPQGSQEVRPVKVLGVEVQPEEGLIQTLAEARIREKRTPTPGSKNRAEGLKTICNAGSYGIFVEVNRKDRKGRVRIHGLGGEPFESEDSEIEELGSDYFPLVGAALTSASHLLLALVETEVARLGGRMVYCDTDSAFVTPAKIGREVGAAFAGLNPYREETTFLKDEAETKAPKAEYPKDCRDSRPRFFGLSSKRYCLFVRDRKGRPHVFQKAASDHGLGSYQVGGDREEWVAQLWEGIIEKGEAVSEEYAGVPATSEFSLSSPNLLPRVRRLGDIRPFTFLTARLLEPSKDPDEPRSELMAFIGPEDHARRAELMHLSRQRSWGSVVEDFVRHTDRKYTFDSEGLAVRRLVLARARNLVGLGKEANRIEDARVLGLGCVGGRAKRYSDVEGRVLGMGRIEAKRLGIPWSTVTRWKRRLRSGKPIADGHGGRALARLAETLNGKLKPLRDAV
jgi:hypothetical protein